MKTIFIAIIISPFILSQISNAASRGKRLCEVILAEMNVEPRVEGFDIGAPALVPLELIERLMLNPTYVLQDEMLAFHIYLGSIQIEALIQTPRGSVALLEVDEVYEQIRTFRFVHIHRVLGYSLGPDAVSIAIQQHSNYFKHPTIQKSTPWLYYSALMGDVESLYRVLNGENLDSIEIARHYLRYRADFGRSSEDPLNLHPPFYPQGLRNAVNLEIAMTQEP